MIKKILPFLSIFLCTGLFAETSYNPPAKITCSYTTDPNAYTHTLCEGMNPIYLAESSISGNPPLDTQIEFYFQTGYADKTDTYGSPYFVYTSADGKYFVTLLTRYQDLLSADLSNAAWTTGDRGKICQDRQARCPITRLPI